MLNEEAQTVTFTYKDQETPVIEQEAVFQNDRQKVEVSVVKKDAETQAEVEGAVFICQIYPTLWSIKMWMLIWTPGS